MKVKDKVILVTGAGSGIGRELALNLLERGAIVAAIDINAESLKETKQLAGQNKDKIFVYQVDITDQAAIEKLSNEVREKQGQIDGIINNAGIIQPFVKVNDLEYPAIKRVLDINFYGTLYMVKTFLPELLKRPEAHIVNISSMGGFLPVPGQSVYGASKAAVKLLTEGLAAELMDTTVRVTVVFPGATNTNISKNSDVKGPELPESSSKKNIPMLSPQQAAEMIIAGMEKNKTRIHTGKDSKFMDLLYRINPNFATNLIAKQMKSLLSN